jgi:crotonobetainyl-CoA:carnitine CoA-transferase CaiB-like acyl-CoA transferase
MSETPGRVRTPAPLLGEQTDEVLSTRLGLTAADLERLRAAGVIRAAQSVAPQRQEQR